ncbi:hypothetical protein Tco_0326814, partial [Tanacetum coccineum]
SYNTRNQATIQDGRVTVQNVQGRQTRGYAGNVVRSNATGTRVIQNRGNATANQSNVIRCYNYRVEAQEAGVALDEEQHAFLEDTGERVYSAPTTSAVFMANLSTYDSDVLSENENEIVKSTTSPEQHDAMIMSVIDEMSSQVAKCNAANKKNKIKNESLTIELKRYKEMVKFFDERQKFELTDKEKHIDS